MSETCLQCNETYNLLVLKRMFIQACKVCILWMVTRDIFPPQELKDPLRLLYSVLL